MRILTLFLLILTPLFSQTTSMVNVESYGAVADGHTDNTNAIRNAIAAMKTGQTLTFPCTNGHYYNVNYPLDFGRLSYMSMQGQGPGCVLVYNGATSAPYAFSLAGAEVVDIRNMDFMSGSQGVAPEVVLMLGRRNANVQSGQFKFNSDRIEGWATKAVVYSIASEENTWLEPTIILNGGGGQYTFYTSGSDDLGINNLASSSNLSLWMENFHLYDFTSYSDPTHAVVYDGGKDSATGNHTYRDGYLVVGNGTGFMISSKGAGTIAWMGLTIDSNRFESGYQMFLFTGGGSFGDVAITNNKTSGVSHYMINMPTNCIDCTIHGNNVNQGDPTTSIFGNLTHSHVSENYPFKVSQSSDSYVFNRASGALQIGSYGSKPACSAVSEGTFWYTKGTGVLQLCQSTSGGYAWVNH